MSGVGEVALVTVIGGGGVYALYHAGSSLWSGMITNFFGRSNHDVFFRLNPIAFVGSVLGWIVFGAFFALIGGMVATNVPALLWALVPAYVAPIATIWRLFTKRQPPLTLTTEVLVERVLAPETAAMTAAMVTDGPTRRLLALIADLPRDADRYREGPDRAALLSAIDVTESDERRRILLRASPAALALLPTLLWLLAGYTPNDGGAAWLSASIAIALMSVAGLVAWRQVRGISEVARVMRDRLSRPL